MMTAITHLICEYRTNPLGIDVVLPRFGWQMESKAVGARQTAYQVRAGSSAGQADLWDSGKVESDQSVHVVYAGKSLASRQRVYWYVTVWDESGSASTSEVAWFELGLLARSDWRGDWIGGLESAAGFDRPTVSSAGQHHGQAARAIVSRNCQRRCKREASRRPPPRPAEKVAFKPLTNAVFAARSCLPSRA